MTALATPVQAENLTVVYRQTARVGKTAPEFTLDALVGREFQTVSSEDYRGKWYVLFFYPLDFTFVCPTEIVEFNNHFHDFRDRDCEVIAASVDSKFSHLGWVNSKEDLAALKFPMLSDFKKTLSAAYGVLDEENGYSQRGTFIVDPEGKLRWMNVNDDSVGRSVKETLRVLDALQTDELCPCNWEKGKETIKL